MAIYNVGPFGQRVPTDGILDQCRCGKPAETEIQIGWIPEANCGAGGGQYEQVCWDCHESDKASRWEDLELDEIPEIAFQLVQTRKPIEVRLRNCAADDWSNEQLVGFRLDLEGEYGSVVNFVDANGRGWLYCQVYRQPVAPEITRQALDEVKIQHDIKKVAFEGPEPPDRGYTMRVSYLNPPADADALVEVMKDKVVVREFLFPAYKIYNLQAHFSEIVDSEIGKNDNGYRQAAWCGIGPV